MIRYIIFVGLVLGLINVNGLTGQISQSARDSVFKTFETVIIQNNQSRDFQRNIALVDSIVESKHYEDFSCEQMALLHHKKGQAYYSLKNWSKALGTFKDGAIPHWNDCKQDSHILEANSYFAAAMSAQFLNNFDIAIPLLNVSLTLYESDKDYSRRKLAQKYSGAGRLFLESKDYELSELYFLKSIDYLKELDKSELQIAIAYLNLGVVNRNKKEYEKAIDYFEKSYDMSSVIELFVFQNLAAIYVEELVDLEKANLYANKILEIDSFRTAHELVMGAYNVIGLVNHAKGNYQSAEASYKIALSYCDSLIQNNKYVTLKASIHENLAHSYLEAEDFKNSNTEIDKAIQLMMPNQEVKNGIHIKDAIIRDKNELISMIAFKADLLLTYSDQDYNSYQADQSLSLYYKIDSLFHLDLSDISLNNSQFFATSEVIEYYEKAIKEFLGHYRKNNDSKYFESAYYFSSQLKALVLANTLKMYKALNEEDRNELRTLKTKLNNSLVNYYKHDLNQDSLSTKIIQYQRDIYEFENSTEIKNDKVYTSFSNTDLNHITEIQSRLTSDEIILEYFEGDEYLFCFLIGKKAVTYIELELTEEILNLIKTYTRSCKDKELQSIEGFKALSHRLYSSIISPLLDMYEDNFDKIIVIPNGILHSLAFEALVNENGEYIIYDQTIAYAYSHKLYFAEHTESPNKTYIGFGPTYTEDLTDHLLDSKLLANNDRLAALNFNVSEIEESAALYTDRISFLNSDASKSLFIKNANKAKILHVSMHSVVDYEIPDNSSLLFSDHHKDFILKASEVAGLNINTELVILSSCQSAAGLTTKGEGVQGLSRAFTLAGSASVLSSLWNASEFASSKILPEFLQFTSSGKSDPESLRAAKLSYISSARPSLQHPFYWANYILLSHADTVSASYSLFTVCGLLILTGVLLLVCFLKFGK